MTTYEALVDLVSREMKVDPGVLEADKPLAAYGLDSLALVDLMFLVEEHFGIDIPTGAARFETLREFTQLIDGLMIKRAA